MYCLYNLFIINITFNRSRKIVAICIVFVLYLYLFMIIFVVVCLFNFIYNYLLLNFIMEEYNYNIRLDHLLGYNIVNIFQ